MMKARVGSIINMTSIVGLQEMWSNKITQRQKQVSLDLLNLLLKKWVLEISAVMPLLQVSLKQK